MGIREGDEGVSVWGVDPTGLELTNLLGGGIFLGGNQKKPQSA